MPNPELDQVQLPSGNVYDLCDSAARSRIDALEAYSAYLGVTTTALDDGSTTNPVTIAGESVTAKHGEIVNYGSSEFIWNANLTTPCWQQFGDLSALGDLAYEDTATGSYTPAGSVSQPTFTGLLVVCLSRPLPETAIRYRLLQRITRAVIILRKVQSASRHLQVRL